MQQNLNLKRKGHFNQQHCHIVFACPYYDSCMHACIKIAGIEAWRKDFCLFNFLSCTDTETPLVTSRLNPPSVAVAVAKCNIQNIARKFAVLTIKSCKSLQERGVDIEDVQMFLITVYSSPPNSKDASGTVTTVLESAKNPETNLLCAQQIQAVGLPQLLPPAEHR